MCRGIDKKKATATKKPHDAFEIFIHIIQFDKYMVGSAMHYPTAKKDFTKGRTAFLEKIDAWI